MAHLKRKGPPSESSSSEGQQSDEPSQSSEAGPSVHRGLFGRTSERQDEDRGGLSGQGSSNIPGKTLVSPDMPSPAALARHLLCPLCRHSLYQPTTLQCGHSICARHVTSSSDLDPDAAASLPPGPPISPSVLPLCPLPECAAKPVPSSSVLPRIPTSSRVHYRPAPTAPDIPSVIQPKTVPDPRIDVTLNKIIGLVSRTTQSLDSNPAPEPDDSDHDPDASSHASSHDHSTRRPTKRRRRHISPPRDDRQDEDDDLLSHLTKQAAHQRTLRHDEPVLPSFPSSHTTPSVSSRDAALARFEKDLLAELTCEICFVLLYQPMTTPCQHTFCARCLQRSLDHSSACPLCRYDLPGFVYFQDYPTNKTLLSIILEAFPMVYKERGELLEAEERDARLDTPVFVCQLSFPGMPTLLHFFEPRYRLMLRRCLESPNPRFGMIMPPKPGAGTPQIEYGTMLEIRSVQMLPDGRSMVETWGSFRFRILERGTLDGYMVGRIERVDDYSEDLGASSLLFPADSSPAIASTTILPEATSSSSQTTTSSTQQTPESSASSTQQAPQSSTSSTQASESSTDPQPNFPSPPLIPVSLHPNSPSNEDLMTTCRSFLDRLQQGTAPWVVQRLSSTYGPMPTDPSAFSFWVALVLPIDEHEKAKLLPLRSARLRLLLLVHWIEQLNNQWWFSSGCTVL